MDKFDRIYALHKLLSDARYPIPRTAIQKKLECSRSTFMRLVNTMRDYLGAPIEYNDNGWYYDSNGEHPYELPGLWFNAQELHALLAIHKLMHDLQPGLLDEQLKPVQKRIEHLLQSKHLGSGELTDRVRVLAMGVRTHADAFQKVAEGVLQRKRLKLHYHARGSNQTTQRTVSPQRLVHYRDNWYLDAWCHKRQALRNFSVDRIKQIKILEQRAEEVDQQTLQDYFADAYGIFSGKADHTAVLRFSPIAARWVAEERWHPRQEGEFLADGQYQLKLPYSNPKELIMDILKYGPDVEVVGPESLREAVREKLKLALGNYEASG
ncbi:transcriptional regulator [Candidatus Tenderia electrophaga]|uniref:Transcriptional regulator n=1 Tax=Candidatus Tenderia electrophaga TaxID=1748243 RepID=A0A0S2TFA8_9GAMM|nr:transcriptional regulator [Candidatus Tenderia electrophaga]